MGDFFDLFLVEVWGDLEQELFFVGGARVESVHFLADGEQETAQFGFVLELAEVGGIGRADVDDEVVGESVEPAQALAVILVSRFEGGLFRLPDIDANRDPASSREAAVVLEAAGNEFETIIREAHGIHESLVLGEAAHAWARVADLGFGSDRADFHESKTHGLPSGDGLGIFIETSGETDGVRELEIPEFDGLAAGFVGDNRAERGRHWRFEAVES